MRLIGKVPAVLLGLCLLAVATDLVWGKIEEHRFNARVAALHARGEPVSFTDLCDPSVPDAQNGAVGLRAAYEWLHADPTRKEPESLWEILDASSPITKEDRARYLAYFRRIEPYFRQVEEALALPHWCDRNGEDLVADISAIRTAVELYACRVRVEDTATDLTQRMEHAAHVCLALSHDRLPWLLGTLLEWTFRTTGPSEIVRGNYRRVGFDAALFRHNLDLELKRAMPRRRQLRQMFVLSRAGVISTLRAKQDKAYIHLPWYYCDWYGRPFLYRGAVRLLDLTGRAIQDCDVTPEACAQNSHSMLTGALEGPMYSPKPYRSAFHGYAVSIARMRLLRVVMALLAVRQKTGEWPADLGVLAPLFPSGIPKDPFTGGPFVYVRTRSGAQIRSSGAGDDISGWDLQEPAEK